MNVKKLLPVVVLLAAGVFLVWWVRRLYSAPPEVPFVRVRRGTLESILSTNGKVEPYEWISARAERAGLVARVVVREGEQVKKGGLLAELEAGDAKAALATAEARIAQAAAELETLKRGGPAVELTEIENAVARARREQEIARAEYESLRRLEEKQAATRLEVSEARRRLEQAQEQIKALEAKRAALVSQADLAAAEARMREAQAARARALEQIEKSLIRAPMSGAVYELNVRPGAYVNPGDLIANIGRLERLRVRLYVDEPELGRVAEGMPVTITWDALPGRKWNGRVERLPTQVRALGSRQVGEVVCTIENTEFDLVPGANVNAAIQIHVVRDGLIVPKEALHRRQDHTGVYRLREDNRIDWRDVKPGAESITQAQILEGVSEGDAVALTTSNPLRPGERVTPVYP